MFGDLFGNIKKQQDELAAQLSEIEVTAEAGDGAVRVTATANGDLKDIKIDPSFIEEKDVEQLEDLLLAAVNEAIGKGREQAAAETQKLIGGMLPPGMGGLFGR